MKDSLSVLLSSRAWKSAIFWVFVVLPMLSLGSCNNGSQTRSFELLEAKIEDIHDAYLSGQLTSRQLVQLYLDRIGAYDTKGPALNSIITVNPEALSTNGAGQGPTPSGEVDREPAWTRPAAHYW